jgi:hypothetical protein
VFSTQAAYAAPLILLAQNRQEQRDRKQAQLDRQVAERTQADTEFLAREIAGVRLALADVVTGEELREQLEQLTDIVERIASRLDAYDATRLARRDPLTAPADHVVDELDGGAGVRLRLVEGAEVIGDELVHVGIDRGRQGPLLAGRTR